MHNIVQNKDENRSMIMSINTKLTKTLLNQRENDTIHSPYGKELAFYSAVQSGDWKKVLLSMSALNSQGMGQLSSHPIRNLQYHLIVSIALITRFCIEGGLDQETAYSLSDLFIQKADKCTNEKEITELHQTMIFEYTQKMSMLSKNIAMSKPIVLCLDYISKNFDNMITLEEIAKYVGLNQTYLSTLFKKEMGITIIQYIQQEKVKAAMNMLKYSDYSYADIGNYLAFSSQSYFISVFRKYTGFTPKQYRNKYYSSNWKE